MFNKVGEYNVALNQLSVPSPSFVKAVTSSLDVYCYTLSGRDKTLRFLFKQNCIIYRDTPVHGLTHAVVWYFADILTVVAIIVMFTSQLHDFHVVFERFACRE